MHMQTHDKNALMKVNLMPTFCESEKFAMWWEKIRCRRLAIIHHAETLRFTSNCFHFINQIKQATLSKSGKVKQPLRALQKVRENPLEVDRRFVIYFRQHLNWIKKDWEKAHLLLSRED